MRVGLVAEFQQRYETQEIASGTVGPLICKRNNEGIRFARRNVRRDPRAAHCFLLTFQVTFFSWTVLHTLFRYITGVSAWQMPN